MCLSTVYREHIDSENILMRNVQTIECSGKEITFTDLLDRKVTIEGELVQANLTEGFVLVREA